MAVADTLRSQNLLKHEDYKTFLKCRISSTLKGFPNHYSLPSFVHLQELLDENWIGERVLDARGYQIMQAINGQIGPSTIVILPSIFYSQLTVAYRSKVFSTSLKALRGSLLTDIPRFIAFILNKDHVHWAPCIVSLEDRAVRQGDSLGWSFDKDLLAKMEWLLGDVTKAHGGWTEAALDVQRQNPGSGSCGIVAFSAIHRFLVTDAIPWSPGLATEFRHRWLAELVSHHSKAMESTLVRTLVFPPDEH
jgi:hypothetical protein